MLGQIEAAFGQARELEYMAKRMLAEALPVGKIITFHKGNMRQNDNAEVLVVSGRRVKIRNQFSKAERWIDFSDVRGI